MKTNEINWRDDNNVKIVFEGNPETTIDFTLEVEKMKLKALFNGKEIEIKISKEAEQKLKEVKKKICDPCPLRKECDTKKCKIWL
jgi:LEA14-like dessication related protein